jgi:hypothetical protein
LAQRNSSDPNLIKCYKKYCKILTSVIKLSNIKPGVPNISPIRVNDKLSTDGQIVTEEFSKYFALAVQRTCPAIDTFNRENPISYLSRTYNQPLPPIASKCVSSKEIEDIIKSLNAKNSHGYDGISTKISSPLTYLYNRMLLAGTFPLRSKLSEIKPIYKTGDKSDTSNYRPISLLMSISNIFEKSSL